MFTPESIANAHAKIAETEAKIAQLHEIIILIGVYSETGCLEEFPTPVNALTALAICIRANEHNREYVEFLRRKYNIPE